MARQSSPGSNVVFAAISNPERRRILDILKYGKRPAGELPSGEDAIVRWELKPDGEGIILKL